MSRRRIVGYNRNNDNSITQIDASGTKLVSTDSEVMVLPAGYGILEIEVRKTTDSDFSGDADQLILYLVSRTTLNRIDILPVSKMEVNYVPKITIKPDPGQKFIKNIIPEEDHYIMIRTDKGTCDSIDYRGDASLCVSTKIKKS